MIWQLVGAVGLTWHTRLIGAALGLLFFCALIELVRRRRLEERYTIMWFFAAAGLIVASLVPGTIELLAHLLGVHDTSAALFAFLLLACLGLILHLTVVVSRLATESVRLAQEVALLRADQSSTRSSRQSLETSP